MAQKSENNHHILPAPIPDLVVENRTGEWRVLRLAPRLAHLAGVSPEDARGRSLDRVFRGTAPPLSELASEVDSRERSLDGIHVRFPGEERRLLYAEIRPGGLTEDYKGRMVTFVFRAREATAEKVSFRGIVGVGPGIREVFRKITLYAPSDASVVITGETGAGKELVARALHEGSPRNRFPFVAVNCSAISEELLESELFGHEKGAFTGAVRTHRGRFERANLGTLFLDEIGDMPLYTQSKLLRVLEEGRIERVGAEEEHRVDVRVVCATNIPLEQAVGRGRFRADLYHRLSVLRIHIPPLRERPEDIPLLVEHFLAHFSRKYSRRIERLTPEALSLLQSYLWPGNVRELRNVLERVYIETQAEVIGARAFTEWIRERQDFTPGDWGLESLERRRVEPVVPPYPLYSASLLNSGKGILEIETLSGKSRSTRPAGLNKEKIRRAYDAAGGNIAGAARLLGVHRATLYRYLEKLGLSREDLRKGL